MKILAISALVSISAYAKDKESPAPNPNVEVCTETKTVKGGKEDGTPKTETTKKECTPAKDKKTSPEPKDKTKQ